MCPIPGTAVAGLHCAAWPRLHVAIASETRGVLLQRAADCWEACRCTRHVRQVVFAGTLLWRQDACCG